MFKIVQNRTFTHDVTATMPVDGGYRDETMKVTFNYLPTDEVAEFDLATPAGTTDFLRAIIARMDDLVDEREQPVFYTPIIRDQLLKASNVRQAILAKYFEAVTKAPEGN